MERIEAGVWCPGSLEAFSDRVAAGASTKQIERRSSDTPAPPRMRITGDPNRIIEDPEELAAALATSGNPESVEDFRDRKVVAGLLLARMLRQLDAEADPRAILKTRLVHGNAISVVDEAYATRPKSELAAIKADGLITNLKHVPILIAAADCAPVIAYDPVNQALGLFHSGYRGTLAEIGRHGLEAMAAAYGTRPEDLHIVIGPYADGDRYQVGAEIHDQFLSATDETGTPRFSPEDMASMFKIDPEHPEKYLFDNGQAIAADLRHIGILPERIEVSQYSTMRDNHLFSSERKEGSARDTMLIMAVLK